MKKNLPVFLVLIAAVILGFYYFFQSKPPEVPIVSQCKVNQMVYYYRNGCQWCQKVEKEGTISKIEKLSVKVEKVNTAFGLVRHNFRGVPTFVIDEEIYSGYRTFDELKEKLGCIEES